MLAVEVLTPERPVLEAEGDEVLVPTAGGLLGIRRGHLPLVAPLAQGTVSILQDKGKRTELTVSGGYLEVLPDRVRILADSAS